MVESWLSTVPDNRIYRKRLCWADRFEWTKKGISKKYGSLISAIIYQLIEILSEIVCSLSFIFSLKRNSIPNQKNPNN